LRLLPVRRADRGDDPSANALVRRFVAAISARFHTRCTGVRTQQAVDHAGRDNELAYQEMLKGLELKRDIESIPGRHQQAKAAEVQAPAEDGFDPVVDRQQHSKVPPLTRRSVDGRWQQIFAPMPAQQIAFTEPG